MAGGADRVDDRERREEAGDDADEHRGADADERDEEAREERAADRAEVVHHPLEPVRLPVDVLRDDVGEERVACRHAEPSRRPGSGAEDADLPDPGRDADQRREDGGRGVAADRASPAPLGVVGKRAAGEACDTGAAVGDPLDQPERTRGRAERRRQEAREKRRRDLVPDVGEETRASDAGDTAGQPRPLSPKSAKPRRLLSVHS